MAHVHPFVAAAFDRHGERVWLELREEVGATEFLGYETTEATAVIRGIVAQNHLLDELTEVGHENPVQVVLDRSPFYAESSFLMYRKDVLTAKGIEMPAKPTWPQVADIAARVDNAQPGMAGTSAQ